MKGNTKKKLLAVIVATIMAIAFISPFDSKAATDYTDVTASATQFDVMMIVPKDTSIPSATFKYNIEPDTTASDETGSLKPGICVIDNDNKVTSPSIADVTFSPADEKVAHDTDENLQTCTKKATVDFAGIEFPEPGVYRYKITEVNTNPGVGPDTNSEIRYLNVYVTDDGTDNAADNLTVISTVSVTTELADFNSTIKTEGYSHNYPTNTLDVSKKVTGNQGSKDQYFKFTITASEVEGTAVIANDAILILSGQDTDPQKTAATTYEADTMKTANNVTFITGGQIKGGYDIYLQHGQTVQITGIPEGCTYTVEEESAKGYTTSYTTKVGTAEASPSTKANEASGTLSDSTIVEFTNDKRGQIPTGVLLSATGLIVVGLIVVVGVVFFGIRSKKRYEEE